MYRNCNLVLKDISVPTYRKPQTNVSTDNQNPIYIEFQKISDNAMKPFSMFRRKLETIIPLLNYELSQSDVINFCNYWILHANKDFPSAKDINNYYRDHYPQKKKKEPLKPKLLGCKYNRCNGSGYIRLQPAEMIEGITYPKVKEHRDGTGSLMPETVDRCCECIVGTEKFNKMNSEEYLYIGAF